MRAFGLLVDKAARLRQAAIPDARLNRVNPPASHLLDEAMREAFDLACAANEVESAADILSLIETWHVRRAGGGGHDSNVDLQFLRRMRNEMERRRIMAGARPEKVSA